MTTLAIVPLSACTTSPLSITGRFDSDTRLLEQGAPSQFNATDVAAQLQQQVPLIYFYAYQAGVLHSTVANETYPSLKTSLADQQAALATVLPNDWIGVALAGEESIDRICGQYESALYELDKNRRAALANLNAVQAATVGIMGLALAAQHAIGIVGISFGLAASLFDTTINSVLFQLPPASVVSVISAQREVFRRQETSSNPEWTGIRSPIAVGDRLNDYIRYCTPAIIEANVGKLLGQTKIDVNGQMSAETQPAVGQTTTSFSNTPTRNRITTWLFPNGVKDASGKQLPADPIRMAALQAWMRADSDPKVQATQPFQLVSGGDSWLEEARGRAVTNKSLNIP